MPGEYGPMRSGYAGLSQPIYGGGGSHIPGWFSEGSNPLYQNAQTPYGMNWDDLGIYGQAGVVGQGIGALAGLAGIWGSFANRKEQRKQNRFERKLSLADLANNARVTNAAFSDQHAGRSAYAASNGGSYTPYEQFMAPRRVSGTLA